MARLGSKVIGIANSKALPLGGGPYSLSQLREAQSNVERAAAEFTTAQAHFDSMRAAVRLQNRGGSKVWAEDGTMFDIDLMAQVLIDGEPVRRAVKPAK